MSNEQPVTFHSLNLLRKVCASTVLPVVMLQRALNTNIYSLISQFWLCLVLLLPGS